MQHRKHGFGTLLIIAGAIGSLIACSLPLAQSVTPAGTAAPGLAGTAAQAGSPTPFVCQAVLIEEPFEHGFMFWVGRTTAEKCVQEHSFTPGSGEIWVAIFDAGGQGGRWLVFTDDWDQSTEPEMDPALTPPANLLQPVRGFGKVWRERLSEQERQALGWATGLELPYTTEYRYEGGGFVNAQGEFVPRPGRHVFKGLAGDAFIFDETSQTFEYTPPQ